MDTPEELVTSYLNGNYGYVKGKLKRARKVTVLRFAQLLTNWTRNSPHPENGISVAIRMLS